MKLHLPKMLLAALLSSAFAAGSLGSAATYSETGTETKMNVINLNFGANECSITNTTGEAVLPYDGKDYSYGASSWTNVLGGSGTMTVTDTLGKRYRLTWSSRGDCWKDDKTQLDTALLVPAITEGYLDDSGDTSPQFSLTSWDGTSLGWKQLSVILSGDNGTFGTVAVNNTNYYYVYKGEGANRTSVLTEGSGSWGTRNASTDLTVGTNMMTITKDNAQDVLTVEGIRNGSGRSTIAGTQIVLGSTKVATGASINDFKEGQSVNLSNVGEVSDLINGALAVNITATEDATDWAELVIDKALRVTGNFQVDGGVLKLNVQQNASFGGLTGEIAEAEIATGKELYIGGGLTSFTGTKVTGSNGTLVLGMGTNATDTGTDPVSVVSLGAGSDIGTVLIASGVLATNDNHQSKGTNLGAAVLRMADSTVYLVRNSVGKDANVTTGDIQLEGRMELRVYGGVGDTTISSNISSVEGCTTSITKTDGGSITLSGSVNVGTIRQNSGTMKMEGTVTVNTILVSAGTLVLGSGNNTTVERVVISEPTATAGNTLRIDTGATLNITGTQNDHGDSASLILSKGSNAGSLTVNGGTLNAVNTVAYMGWNGAGTLNINSGVVKLKGIDFWGNGNSTFGGVLNLGSATEGSGILELGSAGIQNLSGDSVLKLGNGTIKLTADNVSIATSDWSGYTSSIIRLLGEGSGTKFDTQGYVLTIKNAIGDKGSEGNLVAGTGNLVKDGTGTLVLEKALSTTGTITVYNGGLTLKDVTTIGKTIVNNGTLTFGENGSLTLADTRGLEVNGTPMYSDGVTGSSQNGYISASYYVVKGSGQVTGLDKVTLNGAEYALTETDGNKILSISGTSGDYYVNEGTVVYGDEGNSAASDSTTGIVLNGGSLDMKQGLTSQAKEGTGIVAQKAATVTIGESVTLSQSHLTANAATKLAGAGTYDMGTATAFAANVSLADTWSGIVSLSGDQSGPFIINNYANRTNTSTVQLKGVNAPWLKTGESVDCGLILGDGTKNSAGLCIANMSDQTYTFNGKVSGSGVFKVTDGGNSTTPTFKFTGDISEWDGKFESTANGTHNRNLTFSGSATAINADIENGGTATLAITIANDNEVKINGAIGSESTGSLTLTTSGSGVKTFSNDVAVGSVNTRGGDVKFNKNLNLDGTASSITGNATFGGLTTLNGDLTVTGSTTLATKDASIAINGGKSLTTDGGVLKVTGAGDSTVITTSADNAEVTTSNEAITISNAAVTVNSASAYTLGAKLSGSTLSNTGEGTATVKVAEGSTNNFDASQGSVAIDARNASVGTLTVGDQKTVTIGDGTGTATVSGTATLQNGSTVSGNVTIGNDGKLVISGTGFTADGFGAMVEGTLTANATAVSLAPENKIDVSGITATTTYVLATAKNMAITGDFTATDFYTGTLADGMTAAVSVVQPTSTASYALDRATASQLVLTLTAAADPNAPVTLTATAVGTSYSDGTLNINVNPTDLTQYNGKNLAVKVDSEAWKSIVTAMSGVDGGVYNFATITLNNTTLDNFGTVSFNGYTGTGKEGEYFVAYIPEPATATLSLLALAALAARRRRK